MRVYGPSETNTSTGPVTIRLINLIFHRQAACGPVHGKANVLSVSCWRIIFQCYRTKFGVAMQSRSFGASDITCGPMDICHKAIICSDNCKCHHVLYQCVHGLYTATLGEKRAKFTNRLIKMCLLISGGFRPIGRAGQAMAYTY